MVRATDPAHPVPTCPGWTLADLVAHVGRGHRWAAMLVRRRATSLVPQPEVDLPPGADRQADWLLAGAGSLAAAIRSAGPQAAVWSWADDRTAGFWLRRLTHETVIHRLDAVLAVGHPVSLAADLAADGVSDLLTSIHTLSANGDDPVFAGLRGAGETLHFHATDGGLGEAGEWFVRRTPQRVLWQHGHQRADVAVRGPAVDLLLVLNRRATTGVEVIGDERLFEHWLRHSVF